MNYKENNLISVRLRLLLAIVFMSMIALAGCSKSDTGTNPYTGGSTSGGTGYGNTGGSGNTGGGTAGAYKVTIQNMSFSPSTITVPVGSTVTWTNMDGISHTVTSGSPKSPDGKFDSGALTTNGTYSYTFTTKGTYNYYCRFHPSTMTGTVTVQ